MARSPSVILEDVIAAAKSIIAKGGKPTIAKIREELGNKGSPNTISKFLKEWRDAADAAVASKSAKVEPKSVEPKPAQVASKKPVQVQSKLAKKSEFQADTTELDSQKPVEIRVEFEPVLESDKKSGKTDDTQKTHSHKKPQHNNQDRQRQGQGQNNQSRGQNNQGQAQSNQDQGHNNQNRGNQGQNRNQNQSRSQHQNRNQNQNQNRQVRKERAPSRDIQTRMPDMETEIYLAENLEGMSQEQLLTKVRRLETILNKELFRRESAEVMAREAKEYAETIKQQVAARINDIKESMDVVVAGLNAQIKVAKENAEKDLCFYREHLDQANQKIQVLKAGNK